MKNSLFLDDLISVGSVIGEWRMECLFLMDVLCGFLCVYVFMSFSGGR